MTRDAWQDPAFWQGVRDSAERQGYRDGRDGKRPERYAAARGFYLRGWRLGRAEWFAVQQVRGAVQP
jgi:hypothetical protein